MDILVIVDMQNDFITGCLGTKEAQEILPKVIEFVKNFKAFDINNTEIVEDENWGSILAKTQQYIKDNAKEYYENYKNKITIKGYCKSEDTWFDIVEFDVLKNDWKI